MTQKENYPDVLEPLKNEDAERAVLGAVLIDGNVIESIGCILKPEDFDVTKHQKLFRTMCEMNGKGTPIDLVTLSNSLKENALFEEVGGYNYLTYITELTPVSVNCGHYAKIVKEYSNKRKLAEQLTVIGNDIRQGGLDYETACSRLLDFELGENHNSKIKPIPAKQLEGAEPLSPLWGEIIYPECITQVNSEPGVGKSTFFYNLSCFGSMGNDFLGVEFSKRLKIAYVDIETPTWKRKIKLETISDSELPENLYFFDYLDLKSDFAQFFTICKKEKYDLVILDTQSRILNLEQENDNSEANKLMGLLRRLSRETACAIVLIHHTTKSEKKGVYSGRGASAIGGAVDVVVNMELLEQDVIKLKVDKNRLSGDYQTLFIRKIGEDKFEPFIPPNESSSGFERFEVQEFILALADKKTVWATAEMQSSGQEEGFSDSTIKRGISNLSQTGKLKKIRRGVYEIISLGQRVKSSDPRVEPNDPMTLTAEKVQYMPDQPLF